MREKTKAPCRRCLNVTNHVVLADRTIITKDEIPDWGEAEWKDVFEFLECCGCGAISMRETNWFSETPDEPRVVLYPPRVSRHRPHWGGALPFEIGEMLEEVYSALHSDSRCLAMMGARTVLDLVFVDKVGDVRTFGEKLKALEELGVIGAQNREFLSAAVDAGSAAAHRGFKPNEKDLGLVLDIVENLLQAVYVLEDAASELRKRIPTRNR